MQVGNIEPQVLFADRLADLVGQLLESGNKTDRVEVARTIADIHNRAVAKGIEAGLASHGVTGTDGNTRPALTQKTRIELMNVDDMSRTYSQSIVALSKAIGRIAADETVKGLARLIESQSQFAANDVNVFCENHGALARQIESGAA